jgi:hypothetical protein
MARTMLAVLGMLVSGAAMAEQSTEKQAFIPGDSRSLAALVMKGDPAFVILLNKDGTMAFLECEKGCREKRGTEPTELLSSGFIYWEKFGKVGGDPCIKIKSTSGAQYERCW